MDPSTSELPSTVDETLSACPRFRILLAGNSGVGKSSLVSKIFNIDPKDIDIVDGHPGRADITYAYTSDKNPRFVLHDSRGFESGSIDNWVTVKNFLCEQNAKDLSERVHVIWLCIESPRQGSRLLQKGDENLVELANSLGIPVVMVCTKYDMLLHEQSFLHSKKNPGKHIDVVDLERMAESCFHDRVKDLARPGSVIVKVSTDQDYPRSAETLNNLTVVTSQCLGATDLPLPQTASPGPNEEKSLSSKQGQAPRPLPGQEGERGSPVTSLAKESVLVAWAAAQQRDARQKVDVSIREGFKKYWSHLAKSAFFQGHAMHQCVLRLHDDILRVWNFYDPEKARTLKEFFELILQLVAPILEGHEDEVDNGAADLLTKAGSALPSVAAAVPHAIPFLAVAAVGALTIKYLFGIYRQASLSAQYLSAYIIGLTCVLHGLFMKTLELEPPRTLSKELIAGVVKDYKGISAWRVVEATRTSPFNIEGKIRELIYSNIERATFEPPQSFINDPQQVIDASKGAEAGVVLASDPVNPNENAPTVDKPSGKSPELAGGTSDGKVHMKRKKRNNKGDEHESGKCIIV
ncbi:hypothetical protein CVT26_011738 [Gymnopilus dilepis]|uniref:G domain-containing protein n=1 Tax=Gymnopilus dilepis TaxID=231916 RepID=A0A409W5X3_9AGAR|nr:hypothetical protein CVT26_011738 [Gymnopilus dilepis]